MIGHLTCATNSHGNPLWVEKKRKIGMWSSWEVAGEYLLGDLNEPTIAGTKERGGWEAEVSPKKWNRDCEHHCWMIFRKKVAKLSFNNLPKGCIHKGRDGTWTPASTSPAPSVSSESQPCVRVGAPPGAWGDQHNVKHSGSNMSYVEYTWNYIWDYKKYINLIKYDIIWHR